MGLSEQVLLRNIVLAIAVFGAMACTPVQNWRQITLEGIGLEFQLPCKPESQNRRLPLLPKGALLSVTMKGCSYGDMVFALAYTTAPNRKAATAILKHWQIHNSRIANLHSKAFQRGQDVVMAQVLGENRKSTAAMMEERFFNSVRWHLPNLFLQY